MRGLVQPISFERASGVFNGGLGLLLHCDGSHDLLANLSALIVELPVDVVVGENSQTKLATLPRWVLEIVEVTRIGVERDDRAWWELELAEVLLIAEFDA